MYSFVGSLAGNLSAMHVLFLVDTLQKRRMNPVVTDEVVASYRATWLVNKFMLELKQELLRSRDKHNVQKLIYMYLQFMRKCQS